MISILMSTEKKTPLDKRKKGMTLVELMAAMAILLILFTSISQFLVNITKIEDKSNTMLENTTYIKAALTMFERKSNSSTEYYITDKNVFLKYKDPNGITIYFDTIEEMQNKIKSGVSVVDNNKKYNIKIKSTLIQDNIYKIEATLKNNKKFNNEISKKIYIVRK